MKRRQRKCSARIASLSSGTSEKTLKAGSRQREPLIHGSPSRTNVSWKDKDSGEYRTRTEWHAFVEVEGELRYSEYQPKGSDRKVRSAEIHVASILTLDHAEKSETDETAIGESSNDDDTPF
jgi:hypothetical protein